jgi:tetrahydromethanopterin S-methyltransferase subunit G
MCVYVCLDEKKKKRKRMEEIGEKVDICFGCGV